MDSDPSTPATLSLSDGPLTWYGYDNQIPDGHYHFMVGNPYVQAVSLTQGDTNFYSAYWPSPSTEPLSVTANVPLDNDGAGISMALSFSEAMKQARNPSVFFNVAGNIQFQANVVGQWLTDEYGDAETWVGNAYPAPIPITYVGPVTLEVAGVTDTNGNPGGTGPPTTFAGAYQFQWEACPTWKG